MGRTDWLESPVFRARWRVWTGHRLLYDPVVTTARVEFQATLDTSGPQQVLVEHFCANRLLLSRVITLDAEGRISLPLSLLRGSNIVSCALPGRPEDSFVRELHYKTWWRSWIETMVYALILVALMRAFLFQAFVVTAPNMDPTLQPGDQIFVQKLAFNLRPVRTSQLLVYERLTPPPVQYHVERVTALPGQTLSVTQGDRRLVVDGRLWKPPVTSEARPRPNPGEGQESLGDGDGIWADGLPPQVPAGKLLLLSDSPNHPLAGQEDVFTRSERIVGRALGVYWPWDRLGWIQ